MDDGYMTKLDTAYELIRQVITDSATKPRTFSDVQLPMLLVALDEVRAEIHMFRMELREMRETMPRTQSTWSGPR